MISSQEFVNRLGFIILGLTNNFAYVTMLAAAFDLLSKRTLKDTSSDASNPLETTEKYCNPHSTSSILLADIIPSLITKSSYPFFLVSTHLSYKVLLVASLSASSFLITGFVNQEAWIYFGVICASFSSGLGESTFLSSTPLYGDTSLSGWSMGTGMAGFLGAVAYATLRLVLTTKFIMTLMLIMPLAMLFAFFYLVKPISSDDTQSGMAISNSSSVSDARPILQSSNESRNEEEVVTGDTSLETGNTHNCEIDDDVTFGPQLVDLDHVNTHTQVEMKFALKLKYLPCLAKYFIPLMIVYFAEYFINQGLFELIYYREIKLLNHAAQYSWFQVSYQLGVMLSRSSLDLFKIKCLWVMSFLQVVNAVIFLAHSAKLIHIPSFHIVILLIIYEGLLGGFTYTNTFHQLKTEISPERRAFSIGAVAVADSIGIICAGLVALPVHEALCKLYDSGIR